MNLIDSIKASLDLAALRDETEIAWRKECNAQGLKIFYDMSNPTTVQANCDCIDDCNCTVQIGQWNTRPCAEHYEGHQCNLLGNARIVGFG